MEEVTEGEILLSIKEIRDMINRRPITRKDTILFLMNELERRVLQYQRSAEE